MSKWIRAKATKYVLYTVVLLLMFLFENHMNPEYQWQYWEENDLLSMSGKEVSAMLGSPGQTGNGVNSFQKERAALHFSGQDYINVNKIRVFLEELNDSGIFGTLNAGGNTQDIWITKGENVISLSRPARDGVIDIELKDTNGITVRWDKIIFEKNRVGFYFPWNLFLIALITGFFIIRSLAGGQTFAGRYAIRGIFLAEFMIVFLQLRNVFFYFDDYGYLSLSYRGLHQVSSMNYGLFDILVFLKEHYLHWGGRILYFFQEIVFGRSIWILRLIQCLITTGYFAVIYHLCIFEKNNKNRVIAAAVPFLSYALLGLNLMRDGAYWFTASVLYLFPVFWVLTGTILYYQQVFPERGRILGKHGRLIRCMNPLILFLAACSQEQVAAAVAVIVLFITMGGILRTKKIQRFQIISNVVVWAGCLFLLFSPGNRERLSETESGRNIVDTAKSTIHIITSDPVRWITMAFIAAVILITITMSRRTKQVWLRLLNQAFLLVSIGIFSVMLLRNCGILTAFQRVFKWIRLEQLNQICYWLLVIYLGCAFLQMLLWYCIYHRFSYFACLIMGATATLAVAALSPGVSIRMVLPFYLLLIPVICDIYVNFTAQKLSGQKELAGAAALSVLTAVSIMNYHYVVFGYYRNSTAQEYNDSVLKDYKFHETDDQEIQLIRLADDSFGNVMPYQPGYDWVNEYIKTYYMIPDETNIVWVDKDES